MKLPAIPLVVLDTETTGLVPRVNRVIEFAAVRIENGKTVAQYEQLFSIPTEIPETVQVLTRIRPSDLKDQPTLEEKRDEILKIIGDDAIIVGQNVGFDIRMLRGEGIDLSQHPWIDTSMVASLVFPELLSYSLGYVSTVLNLKHEPVHRAMGDVNATLELLSRCWERFLELPHELYEVAQTIMEKSAPGYQRLFQALPQPTATSTPHWLSLPGSAPVPPVHDSQLSNAVFHKPEQGTLSLVEEPLNPTTLQQLLTATTKDPHTVHWIAVKNLDATLRRIAIPDGVCVLSPPEHLLDLDAAALFAAQKSFTADEGTLALKMAWFEPETQCSVRLHGEEYSIWNGKLACTDRSPAYRDQFNDPPSVLLLDHRQLLQFLADPEHCAHGALDERAHIIIDDASMLEDTATKAYGWFCNLDHLRAGAEGDVALTSFTDALQIWIEQCRASQDLCFLNSSHLRTPETSGLRERLEDLLERTDITPVVFKQLQNLHSILDHTALAGRIAFIEQRQNGSQYLQSVPEHISNLLDKYLYQRFPTTLLIPHGSSETLLAILPPSISTELTPSAEEDGIPNISCVADQTVESLLHNLPGKRVIMLLSSRRLIEECFIRYTEALEKQGVTLICQNLSGGLERMQAEFTAAPAPCIWLLTPWTYEGVALDPDMVDHLVIQTLPFDHPNDPILSTRSGHYQNAFEEYTLPRLEHRLFRLVRTFCRHRTKEGNVTILDKRIEQKGYGRRIREHLAQLTQEKDLQVEKLKGQEVERSESRKVDKKQKEKAPPKTKRPKKQKKNTKTSEDQLSLF